MSKPRLLDLFSGAGGCSVGYHMAGFEVVGVDIEPQPHYPFEFHQADALTFPLDGFDFYHASPECKGYTDANLSPKHLYPLLIGAIRSRRVATGKPFVIENVMGSKRYDMRANLLLCGTMFGLPMQRHRLFEIGNTWREGTRRKDGRWRPDSVSIEIGREAMQINWMTINELAEAIPPAYTKFIGQRLLASIDYEDGDVA